jgi:hypothetical protein
MPPSNRAPPQPPRPHQSPTHASILKANVKESRFGLDFVRSKDIVLNGLDNLDARRHVNRLCVAGGVPLVESGTAGHKGQVRFRLAGCAGAGRAWRRRRSG